MRTLIVAPHPDDELLGAGGTLLRRVHQGGHVGWLLMTAITKERGWSDQRITQRTCEIQKVRQGLKIEPHHFYSLNFPTAELDQISMTDFVSNISKVFSDFQPDEVLYLILVMCIVIIVLFLMRLVRVQSGSVIQALESYDL